MVILTQVLGYTTKLPRNFRRGFIDTLRIHVTGGAGGSGLPSYGGIGGAGGNDSKLKAGAGGQSTKRGLIGTPGTDLNIDVPNGITVYNENNIKLGEINSENPKLLVAKGGIGGCSNTGYCGLKGKSTFLKAVSKAKPKIANYPFTTIKPQIGIIHYKDYRQISVADLPGLIEGAHANKGMGHKFLKHIERTKLLLFIVDIHGCQLSLKHDHRSCLETVLLLNKEIELYKPDLLEMPAMIIINKMDTKGATEIYDEIKPKLNNMSEFLSEFDEAIQPKRVLRFDEIFTASLISKNGNEIQAIKEKIRYIIDKYEEEKAFAQNVNSYEDDLLAKLKQQAQQFAPTLV
ncbi:GTP-binding protein 10 homolog [Anthophora quadrimaculata]